VGKEPWDLIAVLGDIAFFADPFVYTLTHAYIIYIDTYKLYRYAHKLYRYAHVSHTPRSNLL
jgi:hypothetical protein